MGDERVKEGRWPDATPYERPAIKRRERLEALLNTEVSPPTTSG